MASDGRKSLMITKPAHDHIGRLATTFDVSQPEIVDALLKCVDETRLRAALAEIAKSRKLTQDEQAKKRALLEGALKDISAGQLETLLKSVGVKAVTLAPKAARKNRTGAKSAST